MADLTCPRRRTGAGIADPGGGRAADRDGEGMAACVAGGAAAVVARTVSVQPAPQLVGPRLSQAGAVRGSLLTTELWSGRSVEQRLTEDYPQAQATGAPLVISLGYTAEHVRRLAPLVRPLPPRSRSPRSSWPMIRPGWPPACAPPSRLCRCRSGSS